MKTLINYSQKSILLIFILSSTFINSKAQTKHNISVSNYSFSPSSLTINLGDTVIWLNTSGYHNVNGQISSYPNNPTSFGNSLGSGWTYSFVFNILGTFNYNCDAHSSMIGQIIVNNSSSTSTNYSEHKSFQAFPNPCNDVLNIYCNSDKSILQIFNITGKLVLKTPIEKNFNLIDIEGIADGLYIFQLIENNSIYRTQKLIKE